METLRTLFADKSNSKDKTKRFFEKFETNGVALYRCQYVARNYFVRSADPSTNRIFRSATRTIISKREIKDQKRAEERSTALPRFVRNSIFHPASLLPFPVSRSSSRRSRSRCKNSPSPLTLSTIRYYSGIISQCLRAVGARPTTRGGSVATVIKMRASRIAAIGFQCNLLSDAQGLNL